MESPPDSEELLDVGASDVGPTVSASAEIAAGGGVDFGPGAFRLNIVTGVRLFLPRENSLYFGLSVVSQMPLCSVLKQKF